jgi:hypothetical protein
MAVEETTSENSEYMVTGSVMYHFNWHPDPGPWLVLHEWQVIVVAGMLGGLLVTYLPNGSGDVPGFSMLKGELRDVRRPLHERLSARGRSAVFGGVAAFILWAIYNGRASFSGTDWTVGEVAASLVVGGAGVGIVRGLVAQANLGAREDMLMLAQTERESTEAQSERSDDEDRVASHQGPPSDITP